MPIDRRWYAAGSGRLRLSHSYPWWKRVWRRIAMLLVIHVGSVGVRTWIGGIW